MTTDFITRSGQGLQQTFWDVSGMARSGAKTLKTSFSNTVNSITSTNKALIAILTAAVAMNPDDPAMAGGAAGVVMLSAVLQTEGGRNFANQFEDRVQAAFTKQLEKGRVSGVLNAAGEGAYLMSAFYNMGLVQSLAAGVALVGFGANAQNYTRKPLSLLGLDWNRRKTFMRLLGISGVCYMLVGMGLEELAKDIANDQASLSDMGFRDYFARYANGFEFLTGALISLSTVFKDRGKSIEASISYMFSGGLLGAAVVQDWAKGQAFDDWKLGAAALFMLAGAAMYNMKNYNTTPVVQDRLDELEALSEEPAPVAE